MAKEHFDNSFDMLLVEHRNIAKELLETTKKNRELEEENRQLRDEVQDLRAYCEQIGKIKTGVLKLFEHIVAR